MYNRQPFQVFNDLEYKKFLLVNRISLTGGIKSESNRTGFCAELLSSLLSVWGGVLKGPSGLCQFCAKSLVRSWPAAHGSSALALNGKEKRSNESSEGSEWHSNQQVHIILWFIFTSCSSRSTHTHTSPDTCFSLVFTASTRKLEQRRMFILWESEPAACQWVKRGLQTDMLTHSSSWQLLSVALSLTNRWWIFSQNHAEAKIRTLMRPTARYCQERDSTIQGINYSEVSKLVLQSLQAQTRCWLGGRSSGHLDVVGWANI